MHHQQNAISVTTDQDVCACSLLITLHVNHTQHPVYTCCVQREIHLVIAMVQREIYLGMGHGHGLDVDQTTLGR